MSLVRRWIRRLLLAAAGLAVIAAGAAWLMLRASLPLLDGEIAVAGVAGEIVIERDDRGIPTVTATSREDLAYATGFVHAQDRFFQMDLTRRSAAGELAALVGAAALDHDRRLRWHRFRARARGILAASSERETALLAAYADGVNAGLAELAGRPAEYRLLRSLPAAWTAEDCLLVVFAMFVDLNDERADRDLERGFAAQILPPEAFAWMYPDGTRWDAPIEGAARNEAPVPGPDVFDLRAQARTLGGPVRAEDGVLAGSNNWAVGGALTADGRAIVANDMHLGLRVPNVYYRARLVATGSRPVDVSGVTLPGAPLVVAGSNGLVAWGFTNSYGDWSDAVVVHPGRAPGTYLAPDGERPFTEYRVIIEVRDAPDEELVIRETIWGPVREDVAHPDGEVAVAWIAHEAAAVNLVQLELETAGSVADAVAIANRMGIPPQNFVTGDADGNIAWTIAGQIPTRDNHDPLLPADGRDTRGFTGWLPPAGYPRIVNPPNHRLWTANARVVDGDALALIGDGGYDAGARAGQIRDGLASRDRFAPADMLPIQLDDRALFLERWRRLLLDVLDEPAVAGREDRAEYRRLAAEWSARAGVDSTGYRLVRAFRISVRDAVFDMLMTPVRAAWPEDVPLRMSNQFEAPLWSAVTERPAHLLTGDHASWRALLLSAVDRNLERFADLPGPLAERTWGERNTAAIRHPLSPVLPFLARWLDMPRDPLPGDSHMPRVQSPAFGASERFAVAPGAEDRSYLHMPGGQSGHPLSPWYGRGHDDWASGNATPFLPGPAVHRLVLRPEHRESSDVAGGGS